MRWEKRIKLLSYIDDGDTLRDIMRKSGMTYVTVHKWIRLYALWGLVKLHAGHKWGRRLTVYLTTSGQEQLEKIQVMR